MPAYRVTLPTSQWPSDVRARFEQHSLGNAQKIRLRKALGRWFKLSSEMCFLAEDVTKETWLERTQGLPLDKRNDIRRALAVAYPEAAKALYANDLERALRVDERAHLETVIARNVQRFPDEWSVAAIPLLRIDPDGFDDGILIQAWAPSTIKRRLEAAALHFDFCRAHDFPIDITPLNVRAKLRADQARVERGDRRLGGVSADLEALTGLAVSVLPIRSWGWLKATRDRLKKLASHHGSRNASRSVDAAELRAAGQQLMDKADTAHVAARNQREFVKAHTKARTALTMILLAEAPIRISSCAEIELRGSLLTDLSGLFLNAVNTKEGEVDRRAFSGVLVDAIGRYVRRHRSIIAAPGETRLLVGNRGGPVAGSQLSKCLGDLTMPVFKVKVTAHAIRHSVGNFIVASAPEEAALASIILNHRSDAVTPVYNQRANQIIASRRLKRAAEQTAAELGVDTSALRRNGRRVNTRLAGLRARRAIKS